MKIKVLDRIAMGNDLDFGVLSELGEVQIFDSTDGEELIPRIEDADVLVINKIKITGNVLRQAKNLKLVTIFATGYDNVDIKAARELGIGVCNVPAYSTDSVALFTVANVLSLVTHLSQYKNHVCTGFYTESNRANLLTPVYHELRGMVWGIVGFGNIGRAVAKVAEAFGAKVIVNKRAPVDDYECVDIDTLCKTADIITLHCPLNDATRGLIDERRLSMMKREVILVNEARGAVVDEKAVADAIISGKIAAFGSDVYSVEPFGKDHPFDTIKGFENVCLTPHAAWGAYEARVRCLGVIVENIKSYLNNKMQNRVDIIGQN